MLAVPGRTKLYFPLAYLLLTQTYCETMGEDERALEKVDEGIRRFPNDAGLVFTKAQVLRKMDRWDDAQELLEQVLTLREHMAYSVMTDEEIFEWKVYYQLAGVHQHKKEFDKAIQYVDMALANKPNSVALQSTKAGYLEHLGRYYDAELAYRRIVETDPARGRAELVNYLLRRKRYAQAIAIVENEIEPGTNGEVVAQLNVAAARAMIEANYGDPLPFLEAALRSAPGNGSALSLMETVLTERGDKAGLARLHADELLTPCSRPGDFARRSHRLLADNRNEEARFAAEQGLQLDPHNPELRFNAAMASFRLGDESRSLHELSRVEGSSPEVFATAMQMRAALLLRQGEPDDALASLEQRLATLDDNVDAVLASARTLVGGGARSEARTLLESRVEKDPLIALELASLLLQDGDIAGAGRVAAAALK
jgi:tetratricopeptide (TPR) repeat protein